MKKKVMSIKKFPEMDKIFALLGFNTLSLK